MSVSISSSATDQARAVSDGSISARELVQAHIDRIEQIDDQINAVVLRRFEEALNEANDVDTARAGGAQLGPLAGVPYTAKECIEVAGMACTDGTKLLEGNVSTADAVVIESLRSAGAILLGKTNIPEFALHYDSNNLVYGATRNPHDRDRAAGGSSGGEGAALVACMTAFGVGSDYGGSIRIPSHFNGCVGLRTGRGRVPYTGHFPPLVPPSVPLASTIGPMARYIEDLQLLLPIFASPSARSPEVPRHVAGPPASGKTVAVFDSDGVGPIDPDCVTAVEKAAAALDDAGWNVISTAPPHLTELRDLFLAIAEAELRTTLEPIIVGNEERLSPQFNAMFRRFTDRPLPSLTEYLNHSIRREFLEREIALWQIDHPVALSPVAACAAIPLGATEVTVDGTVIDEVDIAAHCTWVNLLGLPSTAVPAHNTASGLPVGVQLTGRRWCEEETMGVARVVETAFGGWRQPPDLPSPA